MSIGIKMMRFGLPSPMNTQYTVLYLPHPLHFIRNWFSFTYRPAIGGGFGDIKETHQHILFFQSEIRLGLRIEGGSASSPISCQSMSICSKVHVLNSHGY